MQFVHHLRKTASPLQTQIQLMLLREVIDVCSENYMAHTNRSAGMQSPVNAKASK
jgi:hypothetical protein